MIKIKKALVLTLSDPSGDPRPKRGIELLNEMGFLVDTLSYKINASLKINESFILAQSTDSKVFSILRKIIIAFILFLNSIIPTKWLSEKVIFFWYRLKTLLDLLKSNEYDILLVEDLFFLPLVLKYKKNAKVVFDAREYYPLQREDSLVFRLIEKPTRLFLCKNYLKDCDLFITVSYGLAEKYESEFGVKAHVIRSTPFPVNIIANFEQKNEIKMVHHGVANRNRKIENMIQLMDILDERFTLDIYLQGDQSYINELTEFCSKNEKVKIVKPVLFNEIIPMLNNYDIGLFYVEPTTFNLAHCLPNKLFEFIQARLMVAIGPSPDMARIVNEFECGVVSKKFKLDSMAESLNNLTDNEIILCKQNSENAAQKLNWVEEKKTMKDLIINFCNFS